MIFHDFPYFSVCIEGVIPSCPLLPAGCNGQLPKGGTEAAPLELFVANAGTAARFLSVPWMGVMGSWGFGGLPSGND